VDSTITMFDVIRGWMAENYPQLHVRMFHPQEVYGPQVRVYIKPDTDSFDDCILTLYADAEVKSIWYTAPIGKNGSLIWEHLTADVNRPDYFTHLKAATELGLKYIKWAH